MRTIGLNISTISTTSSEKRIEMMSNTELKIIDTISGSIGNSISISGLTTEIKDRYGSAYYPNIYKAILSLKNENIIQLEKQGKASIPILNFTNYLLPDILIETELQKKRAFLEKWPEAQSLLASLDNAFSTLPFIRSIILIDPQHNMKLNRAELLIIISETDEAKREETRSLMREIRRHFIRTEYLILAETELINALKSQEKNPIKEMLSSKIALYSPEHFWTSIRNAYAHGMRIRFEMEQTNPLKISNRDLIYNLARFGYKELGSEIRQGTDIAIEYIIASILLNGDKRQTAAIPILLAKNKTSYDLLAFLSQKYGFADMLLGILIALEEIAPSTEIESDIATLKEAGIRPIASNKSQIKNAMQLYGVGIM
jgi:predicted transcriptional regulator